MNYLVIVDVQNDFVTGSLGTKEAEEMLPTLLKKVENFDGTILLTKDSHTEQYLMTQEGKNLPVSHCVIGTNGWELPTELEEALREKEVKVYQKPGFGSFDLVEDLKKWYEEGKVESVELVGICTDICVVSNALLIKSALTELPILVDASCCAGVTKEKHLKALDVMESCQIKVVR